MRSILITMSIAFIPHLIIYRFEVIFALKSIFFYYCSSKYPVAVCVLRGPGGGGRGGAVENYQRVAPAAPAGILLNLLQDRVLETFAPRVPPFDHRDQEEDQAAD